LNVGAVLDGSVTIDLADGFVCGLKSDRLGLFAVSHHPLFGLGHQQEVAGHHRARRTVRKLKPGASFGDENEDRVLKRRVANGPRSPRVQLLPQQGAGLEKADDLGQGIENRTISKKLQTLEHRASGRPSLGST
jgi:hypothetical protein